MSRGAHFKTYLFKNQTAPGSASAGGALALASLPGVCLLLMLFLENPWPVVLAFLPAYTIFLLYVLGAVRGT